MNVFWSRRFDVIVLIVTTLVIFAFSAFAFAENEDLVISVRAGYDHTIRVGSTAPFYISVENNGENFSGEIQVEVYSRYRSKTIYALPFELPKGSSKELVMNIPIKTSSRDVDVKIVKGTKIVSTFEYKFLKMIRPEYPVIGVLSDDKTGLRNLNGLKLSENTLSEEHADISIKRKVMIASGEIDPYADVPVEIVHLDENQLPDNHEAFSTFDYIVIADYDTSLLSDKQKEALLKWLEAGNVLVLGTGPNASKVYKGLDDSLKPFGILGEAKIPATLQLEEFTGMKAPEEDIIVSTGNINNGKIIMGSEAYSLAVRYGKGEGTILFLAFDPTLSPISNWSNVGEMWKKLLSSKHLENYNVSAFTPTYKRNFNSIVNQVPETQTPPVNALMLLILVYIIMVGPLLYIFLKKKDKRDLSWVVMPVLAFLCVGIIYMVGFKTRYTTAVLNKFSIINLDIDKSEATIDTYMGAFNNRRSNMIMEYSASGDVSVNPEQDIYYVDSYNSNDYENAVVASKLIMGDPMIHEQYNVGMWQSVPINASKKVDFEGKILVTVDISNNRFSILIDNNTAFNLEEAFICIGDRFIDIGDINPWEKGKRIEVSINDTLKVMKGFNDFINSRYDYAYRHSGNALPKGWQEDMRKRQAIEEVFVGRGDYSINRPIGQGFSVDSQIGLYAINYDDIDYGIKINDKRPESYNMNIIYTEDIDFEKGKSIVFPYGMISAVFEGGEGVSFEGRYGEMISVYKDTEVYCKFMLPENIKVDDFEIAWSVFRNNIRLYIYNNATSEWEEFPETFRPERRFDFYIDNMNEIRVKASVNLSEAYSSGETLVLPEIQISGVME